MARKQRKNPSANGDDRETELILSPRAAAEVRAWLDRLETHAKRAIASCEAMDHPILAKWSGSSAEHWQKVIALLNWQRFHLKSKK